MTDPIRTGSTGPVRPTPPTTRPIVEPDTPLLDAADSLQLGAARSQLHRPKGRTDSLVGAPRPVSPWVQQRIDGVVGTIFHPGLRGGGVKRQRGDTSWEPRAQAPAANGALPAPRVADTRHAQAPGAGTVTPSGLVNGNTVLRHDGNGEPTNYTQLDQGSTNGCGTTSLAMILNYFAGGKALYSRESVDRLIRHNNMFTSPSDVAAFAEDQGFEARVHTGTTPDELRRLVDAGLPAQILLDVADGEDGTGLHYEVVTGYGRGPDGKPYFELSNPWGHREYMAEDVLVRKWSNLKAAGLPVALDRVAIVMKPPGNSTPLPADDRGALNAAGVALRTAQGITQVSTGWSRKEPYTLVAGLVRGLVGGLAGSPAVLLDPARRVADAWLREGREERGGGGWQSVRAWVKLVGGGVMRALGRPLELAASGASWGADKAAVAVLWFGEKRGRRLS